MSPVLVRPSWIAGQGNAGDFGSGINGTTDLELGCSTRIRATSLRRRPPGANAKGSKAKSRVSPADRGVGRNQLVAAAGRGEAKTASRNAEGNSARQKALQSLSGGARSQLTGRLFTVLGACGPLLRSNPSLRSF
jgi:hypothetical protein